LSPTDDESRWVVAGPPVSLWSHPPFATGAGGGDPKGPDNDELDVRWTHFDGDYPIFKFRVGDANGRSVLEP
jgi:hypothetical protein